MAKAEKRLEVQAESDCIYCGGAAATMEHMPPKIMFTKKDRPPGMEFATCKACNNGTGKVDLVASLFARLSAGGALSENELRDLRKIRDGVMNNAPEVITEILSDNVPVAHNPLLPNSAVVKGDLPVGIGSTYLDVFSAKLGMAMFREYMGHRLPNFGNVHSAWFLSGGLDELGAQAFLEILPISTMLSQGAKKSGKQFNAAINTDNRRIVAVFARFHGGLSVFSIASIIPEVMAMEFPFPNAKKVYPGELLSMMP
ncbi:hypothetical protein MMA231_02479 [Asticcacaulis sp. MM231]|uniref:hypothetical protein n=1 Tax=Asticcacaulis sp. MM231 TaxID=3157666 RepID=UPI0032D5818D